MSTENNDVRPVRVQRSRAKGSKLVSPNGLPVVCVTRGTKWGNPFKVGQPGIETAADAVARFREVHERQDMALVREEARRELAGKNLACWCKPGEPCHADVLLAIANA